MDIDCNTVGIGDYYSPGVVHHDTEACSFIIDVEKIKIMRL